MKVLKKFYQKIEKPGFKTFLVSRNYGLKPHLSILKCFFLDFLKDI